MSDEARLSRGLLSVFLVLAALMQTLDSTIANVALTRIGGDLAAASDQVNWVLTSYIVMAAITTPVTGWLADRIGQRRLFVLSALGFVAASMACGMAQSIGEIVLFRAIQGVFGAPLVPLSQAVLFSTAPPNGRARAMALFGMGIMVGPIAGPALGGWLCDYYNWRWVFYVNVPIGLAAAAGLWRYLPLDKPATSNSFDFQGFAYLALGVAALQLFLDRGSELNWFQSTEIRIECGLAILGCYLYIVHTLTAKTPLIDLRVYLDRNVMTGLLLIFIVGIVLMSTLSLLSPFVENIMNYPVLTAGLVLAPRGIGTIGAMIVVGRLGDRYDPRLFLGVGLLVLAFALFSMSKFSIDTSAETLIWTGIVQGIGFGLVVVPLTTMTFATLDQSFRTDGTAVFSLFRNVGGSVGISALAYVVTRQTTVAYADIVSSLTPFSLGLRQAVSQAIVPTSPIGAETLHMMALSQAQVIAYNDVFLLMAWMVVGILPLLLLIRRPPQVK